MNSKIARIKMKKREKEKISQLYHEPIISSTYSLSMFTHKHGRCRHKKQLTSKSEAQEA